MKIVWMLVGTMRVWQPKGLGEQATTVFMFVSMDALWSRDSKLNTFWVGDPGTQESKIREGKNGVKSKPGLALPDGSEKWGDGGDKAPSPSPPPPHQHGGCYGLSWGLGIMGANSPTGKETLAAYFNTLKSNGFPEFENELLGRNPSQIRKTCLSPLWEHPALKRGLAYLRRRSVPRVGNWRRRDCGKGGILLEYFAHLKG